MNIELHVIQNVAPANLNRDDTGAPKDAVFGGYRRARVSSQAWKRAIRTSFATAFSDDELAWRTRRLVDEAADRLVASGREPEAARKAVASLLEQGSGAKVDEKTGHTAVLWLVSRRAADTLAKLCEDRWDALSSAKKLSAGEKKVVTAAIENDVVGSRAVDIALFGRMLTDAPERGTVFAASQVAHAISTHVVETDFDYFTAVDDLLPSEESGAGMVGTVEFNSACFYRYACLNTEQLVANLSGDVDLARRGAAAFSKGFISVMPTGKQNSFAAHNPPAVALVITRASGSWNLANAFAKPIRPRRDGDLVRLSCEALARHWGDLTAMYGNPASAIGVACLLPLNDVFEPLEGVDIGPVDETVTRALNAALPDST